MIAPETDFYNADERFMQLALDEARKAAEAGEIPIGAVVVANGKVLGKGHNMTEALGDVTAHAEMMAISAAALKLGNKYLDDCTLYVTVEPCPMCAGAIGWAQLRRIVIGTPDAKGGYSAILKQGCSPFHPKAQVVWGVLADSCAAIMKQFFAARRRPKQT